jgi:DNA-directed RNA polymerase subunit omega
MSEPSHEIPEIPRMATRASLMTPRMEHLLERVDSKFTLVTLSAMRAREINDYYNQLGEGLGKIVPPQVTSVSRKPLSIAMEEIEVGKIESIPLPTEEELAEIAAAEAAAAEAALAAEPPLEEA